jgi:hypothetical protein
LCHTAAAADLSSACGTVKQVPCQQNDSLLWQ